MECIFELGPPALPQSYLRGDCWLRLTPPEPNSAREGILLVLGYGLFTVSFGCSSGKWFAMAGGGGHRSAMCGKVCGWGSVALGPKGPGAAQTPVLSHSLLRILTV